MIQFSSSSHFFGHVRTLGSSTAQDIKWPKGGELDILEYANDESNKVTFHTDRMCKLNVALAVFPRFVFLNLFI